MLLPSDIAAAQNSQLTPNAQASLRSVSTVRSVTLATAEYTEYPVAPLGTQLVVISYTFPTGIVSAGTHVHVHLYGAMEGVVGGFSPTIWFNQPNDTNITQVSYGSSGATDSWILDADFSLSTAGATIGNRFGVENSQPGRNSPSLTIRGMIDFKVGGPIGIVDERINTRTAPPPDTVFTTAPLQLFVTFLSDIAFTVHGGYMEAL